MFRFSLILTLIISSFSFADIGNPYQFGNSSANAWTTDNLYVPANMSTFRGVPYGTGDGNYIEVPTYIHTSDFNVLDVNAGATFSNYGCTSDVNATLPDANTAMLNKVYHFVDVNATYKFTLKVDANTTVFNATDNLDLSEGQDVQTGVGKGAMNIKYVTPEIIFWVYCGDANAI